MKECPRHPGMDTMVPCLKCGRYFCRLCAPPREYTHYCEKCGAESLDEFKEKIGERPGAAEAPARGKAAEPGARAPVGETGGRDARGASPGASERKRPIEGPKPVERRAVPGGPRKVGPSESTRAGGRPKPGRGIRRGKPSRRAGPAEEVGPRAERRGRTRRLETFTRRFRPSYISRSIDDHARERAEEREERRNRVERKRAAKLEAREKSRASVRERLSDAVERSADRLKSWVRSALLFGPRQTVRLARLVRGKFPVGLVERQAAEGWPPLKEKWRVLLAVILGGSILWVISVAALRARWAVCGYVIAVLVGAGCVRVLGLTFSLQTGVVAGLATVVSLIVGEILVLALYRFRILRNIGIGERAMALTSTSWGFMLDFFWWFVVGTLLVSGVIAFLIGLWPLPARPGWRGFGSGRI